MNPNFNSEELRKLFDDAFTEGQKEMARPIDFPIGEYERSPFGYEPAPIKQHSDEALIGLERYWYTPRPEDSEGR